MFSPARLVYVEKWVSEMIFKDAWCALAITCNWSTFENENLVKIFFSSSFCRRFSGKTIWVLKINLGNDFADELSICKAQSTDTDSLIFSCLMTARLFVLFSKTTKNCHELNSLLDPPNFLESLKVVLRVDLKRSEEENLSEQKQLSSIFLALTLKDFPPTTKTFLTNFFSNFLSFWLTNLVLIKMVLRVVPEGCVYPPATMNIQSRCGLWRVWIVYWENSTSKDFLNIFSYNFPLPSVNVITQFS